MIVGSTCSEIGDVLIIESQVAIPANYMQVSSYVETTTGETGSRFFDKQFRASQDGLLWTDWMPLNMTNMQTIEGTVINNNIFFQFRFERKGTDTTGLLEFVSISINGSVVPYICESPITDKSIFKGLTCGNFITTQLCSNLLKKLYHKGILPNYMDRGVSNADDEDFIVLWSTIACYLSMFVTYMSKFDTIFMQRDMLLEYLLQQGVNVCEYEELLVDLQYISEHLFDEIRKRGTKQVFLKKGEILNDGSAIPVAGEIIRMTCTDECDEFLWVLSDETTAGWNLGNSSPIYRGNFKERGLIKGYEITDDFVDLSKYRQIHQTSQGISPDLIDGTKKCLFITSSSTPSGFGVSHLPTTDYSKGIIVSPYIDYEITFDIAVSGNQNNLSIDFGVDAFDCFGNEYALQNVDGSNFSNRFFTGHKLNQSMKFYSFRGIVYRLNSPYITHPDNRLSAGIGSNLRFINDKTNKLIPYLTVTGDGQYAMIHNFKVRPLRKDYSLGFLNTNNILQIWSYNKNLKRSLGDIRNTIRRFLIPYNTILKLNRIKPLQTVPNDTIVYIHIDTTSMSTADQASIRQSALEWWSIFKASNSDFEGSLIINTVPNSTIDPDDHEPGRGSNQRCSISGSTLLQGTIERWLQNPTEGMLRQAYKEGLPTTFANEEAFLEYIQGRSLIVLTFIDETNNEYHSSAVNLNNQPTQNYKNDYANFMNKIFPKLEFFKAVLFHITRVNVAEKDAYLLQAMSAMEAKSLDITQINNILGQDKVDAYGLTNMTNKFYTPLSAPSPYYQYNGLLNSGWKYNFTKMSPITNALLVDFNNELNALLAEKILYDDED